MGKSDLKAVLASIGLWLALTGVGVALDITTKDYAGAKLIEYASSQRLVLLDQSFPVLIATLSLLLGIKLTQNDAVIRGLLVSVIVLLIVVTVLKKIYLGYGINNYTAVETIPYWCWAIAQLLAVLIFIVSTFVARTGQGKTG